MAIERNAEILRSVRILFGQGTFAGLSDRELLDLASRRDDPGAEPAFAALVERHGPMVLRVCRARLLDPNDADDAFQRVFCLLAQRSRTLWVRNSLAPWLLQVTLRVVSSVRSEAVRRRDRERRYAEATPQVALLQEPDDLSPILLDEVGRLPERFRSAVVLCDLQGLTHEEAARRLGWPIGTVKSRQARARDRLRRRLLARGLAPAALASIPFRSAPAAIPRPLAERAVRLAITSAASGIGPASGAVSFITGALTMLTAHPIAVLTGGLLLTGAVVVGAGALALQDDQGPRGKAPRPAPAAAPRVTAVQLPRTDDYEGPEFQNVGDAKLPDPEAAKDWQAPPVPESIPVTVSGTAINTAKRPVSGATVMLMSWFESQVLAQTTTDQDGAYRFEAVEVPVDEFFFSPLRPEVSPSTVFVVVATCPEYGITWSPQQRMYAIDSPHPLDIQRYLPLGKPVSVDLTFRPAESLRGTVVDEEGRPREGIEVSIRDVDLLDADGLETSRNLDGVWKALPDGLGRATTGSDGRFLLDGLPSEACCWVRFQNPEFETYGLTLYAATTAKPVSRHPQPRIHSGRGEHDAYAGDMIVTLPTPRLVPVRVVGDDSGEPVADARVNVLTESMVTGIHSGGRTDADGLVTLAMPPGTSRGLVADPPIETQYLRTYQEPFVVAPEPDEGPRELRLRAGLELLIDAVDAATGEPLPNALYWLVPTNDPQRPEQIQASTFGGRSPWTDADGRLRAVLPPKPGQEYRVRFAGMRLPNHTAYHFPNPSAQPRFEVDPPLSEPFELIGGETIRLRFSFTPIGPEAELSEPPPADPAAAPPPPAAPNDGPNRGDDAHPETIPVTVSGRATDTGGRPIGGATVLLLGGDVPPGPSILARTETDEDGVYRFEEIEVPVAEGEESPFPELRQGPYARVQVLATHPGSGPAWQAWAAIDASNDPDVQNPPGRLRIGDPVTIDLTFRPAESLLGTILDEQDRPIEGVELRIITLTLLDTLPGEPERIPLDVFREFVTGSLGLASTGPDGRFRMDGIPLGTLCQIQLIHPDFETVGASFRAVTLPPTGDDFGSQGHVDELFSKAMAGDFVLTVPTPRPVRVRVVDDNLGAPIAGVIVNLLKSNNQPMGSFAWGTSDAEGILTLGIPQRDDFGLRADPPAETLYLRSELRHLTFPVDAAEDTIEMRLQAGCELIIDSFDAETGKPLLDALYWLVPMDEPDQPRPINQAMLRPEKPGSRQSDGRLRAVIPPEPGREFQVRFAGVSGQYPSPFSPAARERLPRAEVDPPLSEPFELIGGETIRLQFAIRPIVD